MARLICLSGVDGTGKTTAIQLLRQHFLSRGDHVSTLWLRFNHFFVKPALWAARICGLTTYRTIEGHRIGVHRFYRSRLLSFFYLWGTVLDTWRARLRICWRSRSRNTAVLLDRFTLDILVDAILATGIRDLDTKLAGRLILAALPKAAQVVVLQRATQEILHARPECKHDPLFSKRLCLYDDLAARYDVRVVHNTGTIDQLYDDLKAILAT